MPHFFQPSPSWLERIPLRPLQRIQARHRYIHPKRGITTRLPFLTFLLQSSAAAGEINSFLSDLRGKPEFTTFSSLLGTTAIPTEVTDINGIPTITAIPEFTGLPKDAQDFYSSVYDKAQSIIRKDLSGAAPQPTGILMAAGAAAAGVLGVAALM